MSLTKRILSRHKEAALTSRVALRFKQADYDGKFLGKDARLQWGRHQWFLEELPQKGKKKLKSKTLQNPSSYGAFDMWIPENILHFAKLTSSDDFEAIEKKLLEAYDEAYKRTASPDHRNQKETAALEQNDWIKGIKWYGQDVFYLNVIPEGVDEFVAEGKNFSVKVKWGEFASFSPDSDFQQADPHYTKYVSKSPTAARKFYMMLKQDPKQLSSVSWDQFGAWLDKNKIPYDTRFSSWH